MQHKEIIISGAKIYLAPDAEAFPLLDDAPAGNWALLGTGGDLNLGEEGITVSHEQTLSKKRTLGSTGPIKVVRSEEELIISGVLSDLSVEEYAKIMNGVTLTDTAAAAGTPGVRDITLRQGPAVTTFTLLIRGENISPYGGTWSVQYDVPVVYQSGNPSPVFNKTDSADLAFEFTALEDPNAATAAERFGNYYAQDADAV